MSKNAGADEGSVKSTLEMGLPLLLGGLNSNASKPEGMNAIMKGLSQTGTSNPAGDITSYLSAPASTTGSDMLSSLLGSNAQPIQQAISKSNGLPAGVVNKILTMALPLLMSSLKQEFDKERGARRTYKATERAFQDGFVRFTQRSRSYAAALRL